MGKKSSIERHAFIPEKPRLQQNARDIYLKRRFVKLPVNSSRIDSRSIGKSPATLEVGQAGGHNAKSFISRFSHFSSMASSTSHLAIGLRGGHRNLGHVISDLRDAPTD
jgi:hypothetical protein